MTEKEKFYIKFGEKVSVTLKLEKRKKCYIKFREKERSIILNLEKKEVLYKI